MDYIVAAYFDYLSAALALVAGFCTPGWTIEFPIAACIYPSIRILSLLFDIFFIDHIYIHTFHPTYPVAKEH